MKIILDAPKEIIIVPEMTRTVTELIIKEMVDNPENKTIRVNIERLGHITLWEGEDYDLIGQWTDDDVIARIRELYS